MPRITQEPQSPAPTTKQFRTDIQALRATAVLLVIANHFWPQHLTGGYIGVDIFFVISGYLITLHLLKELTHKNTLNFKHFYASRARRLLPAALFVGAISFAATLILTPSNYWTRTAWDFFAASAYFHNWNLYTAATDYFAQDSNPTVFQHYWSLSVEEQFYLIWPLALTIIFTLSGTLIKWIKGREQSKLIIIAIFMVFLAGTSLFASTQMVEAGHPGAYFSTFTRAWEFMVGGLIALSSPVLARFRPQSRESLFATLIRNVSQLAAYLAIGFSAFFFTGAVGVPGPITLIPVLATAIIIALGPDTFIPWLRALVEWRPVQFTGDISYSLYLWHWPVAVLLPFILKQPVTWWMFLLALIPTYLLAFITQRFVEEPFRFKIPALQQPRIVLLSVISTLLLVASSAFGANLFTKHTEQQQKEALQAALSGDNSQPCIGAMAIADSSQCPDIFTQEPLVAPAAEDQAPWHAETDGCETIHHWDVPNGGALWRLHCNYAESSNDSTSVWIVGDSHSEQWRAAFLPLAEERKWDLTYYTHSGCPLWTRPLSFWVNGSHHTPVRDIETSTCSDWSHTIQNEIEKSKPDVIILSTYSTVQGIDDGSGASQEQQYKSAMAETLKSWRAWSPKVIVLKDTPRAGTVIGPECVSVSGVGCVAPANELLAQDPQFEAAKTLGVATIDMTDYFCPDDTCYGVIGGLPVFFDTNHISKSYSISLSTPLAKKLEDALQH
ncbi:acyltransferase family protein [Rothia nasimurium]|uniref:acyltransferase family protein n=1 Tax=Rothia nasimurium TaxID=85336 RepID=UPI003BA289C4